MLLKEKVAAKLALEKEKERQRSEEQKKLQEKRKEQAEALAQRKLQEQKLAEKLKKVPDYWPIAQGMLCRTVHLRFRPENF